MKSQRQRKLIRITRFAIMGLCLAMVYFMISRYQPWTMDGGNDSMVPAYPPGTRLLVDFKPRSPIRNDVVIYQYESGGRTARVAALGGDRLTVKDKILHLSWEEDGETKTVRTVHRIQRPEVLPQVVPPGHYLLLNDNPKSRYPDSLIHGPVSFEQIKGRVMIKVDFL